MSPIWLKQTISFWLMPLPICVLLLTAGSILLFTNRRVRLGKIILLLGVALLLVFSNRQVARVLGQALEADFRPIPDLPVGTALPSPLAACRYISVLGGGHTDSPGFSANNKLNSSALARLIEGVRLARALPEAKLVVSGTGYRDGPSNAEIMKQLAVTLGIDSARIIRLDSPLDTMDEAQELKGVIGSQPFALVTSAWHMRRAAALMRHAGLAPVPCPADYLVRPMDQHSLSVASFFWDPRSLDVSTAVVHEHIGYVWAWLRGRI